MNLGPYRLVRPFLVCKRLGRGRDAFGESIWAKKKVRALRLFLLTALTMVAFAANSVLNRMAVADGQISAEYFALVRVVAGAVGLALLTRDARLFQRPSVWGVLGLSAYLVGFSQAYIALDAGLGALILFGVVQVTMFAGALIGKEVVPASRWLGMSIAFAGLTLALGSNFTGGRYQLGIVFMVTAAVGWGIYSLVGRATTDPLAATARNFIWSVPVVGLTLIDSEPYAQGLGIFYAVLSGAVTSGLGYALWYAMIPELGASRAAVVQLTVPVIAIFGGVVLLGEPLSLVLVVATALVLGGVGLALRNN